MIRKARTGIEDDDLAEQVGDESVLVPAAAKLRNFEGETHIVKKEVIEDLLMEGKRERQSRVVEIDGFPVLISTIEEAADEVDSEDESPFAARKRMQAEQRAWHHQNTCFSCKKGPHTDRYFDIF
jgi:hypothetical protein